VAPLLAREGEDVAALSTQDLAEATCCRFLRLGAEAFAFGRS
jgi:hypothetical protein